MKLRRLICALYGPSFCILVCEIITTDWGPQDPCKSHPASLSLVLHYTSGPGGEYINSQATLDCKQRVVNLHYDWFLLYP